MSTDADSSNGVNLQAKRQRLIELVKKRKLNEQRLQLILDKADDLRFSPSELALFEAELTRLRSRYGGGIYSSCRQCGGDGGAGGRCPKCGGTGFEP
jgi:hypothetical protein